MTCEYGLEVLREAHDQAAAKSLEQPGTVVKVVLKCRHPEGCSMTFDASAKDGKERGGGIQSGMRCRVTGGRPN